MTCDCADPIVFGHNHEPPTYAAGETFTTTPEAIINAISHAHLPPMSFSTTMQGHHGGHVTLDEGTVFFPDPNDPIGNWLELGHTHPFRIELWGTNEPCT